MPQELRRPETSLASEEHRLCVEKARCAAGRNADGKKVNFQLSGLFLNLAADIGRRPIWREIAELYDRKGWPFLSRCADRRVRAAKRVLAKAQTSEEQSNARKSLDEATEFQTLANVLRRRFEDVTRMDCRRGAAAFFRAIKAAIKEARNQEKTAYWSARYAIRNEGMERHMAETLLQLGPPPDSVDNEEWRKIVTGPEGERDPRKPYDAKALATKYDLAASPGTIRRANLGQRRAPVR